MITAYVLVVTDPQTTKTVVKKLGGIPGIVEVNEVMGPYDIVIKCISPNLREFQSVLGETIRQIQNVVSTISLVTFPS